MSMQATHSLTSFPLELVVTDCLAGGLELNEPLGGSIITRISGALPMTESNVM